MLITILFCSVRLAFVLCFVMFVLFVAWLIGYMVPDMPKSLELKVKREKWLAHQADKQHRAKQEEAALAKKEK